MLSRFEPVARQTVVWAGMLAGGSGRGTLSDGFLLLALAEAQRFGHCVDLGVSAEMVRAELAAQAPHPPGHGQPETLGIDLGGLSRRTLGAGRLDDPSLWRLSRSKVRPLRVTLSGPTAEIVLDGSGRKAIEVAQWASRRGQRAQVDRADLLWGLLADAASEPVRILHRYDVDLGRLWAELRCWHQPA
jgi:hypothetical protein